MAKPDNTLECFDRLRRDLHDLNRSTEEEFLSVGERLQSISTHSKQIAGASSAAARLMDGEEFSSMIEGLRRILGGVQKIESGTGTSRETLEAMLGRMRQSTRLLAGFERLVLQLKVLALHTRVESARIRDCETDFNALGDEVVRLAANIKENSESIQDGSGSVQALVRATLGRVDEIGTRQRDQISALVADVTAGLDSLTRNHAQSAEAAAGISAGYERVCRRIGEVVQSLQFQDITRQQVEHVQEALEEVSGTMRRSGRQTPETLSLGAKTTALQVAQLRNSRDTLVSAVNRILENLRSISEEVRRISKVPVTLTGSAESGGGSFLEGMKARLAAVAADLTQYARSSADVRDAIVHVVPEIEKMSGHAGEIEAIGVHLGRVALNAQVKTAQIGKAGAALGVLAGSIQELTTDTSARTAAVAEHLRMLATDAHTLKSSVAGTAGTADSAEESGDLESLAAGIVRGIEKLSELNETIAAQLTNITTTGSELCAELEQACASINSHTRVEAGFGQAMEALEKSAEALSLRLPKGYRRPAELDLPEQKDRYTMNSERQVHGEFGDRAAAAGAAGGEVLSPASGERHADEDLGDNVELF